MPTGIDAVFAGDDRRRPVHRAVLSLLRRVGHAGRPRGQGGHRALGQARRDRHHGARRLGALAARACRCCWSALFCLGTHSTVFGPIKYALLPQHLRDDELVAGNALIEAGTFLAILLGTILGGSIVLIAQRCAGRRRPAASARRRRHGRVTADSARRRRSAAGRARASAPAARLGGRRAACPAAVRRCCCRFWRSPGSGCSARPWCRGCRCWPRTCCSPTSRWSR